jgi:AAA15 family ATPase/GTPase
MIRKFGFRNFASFKEGAEISFLRKGSSSDDFESEVGTVLGLKGANGSGKTNILKALSFLYSFCTKRMNTRGDETEAGSEVLIPFETFFQYEDIAEFYIEFSIKEKIYYYELDISKDGIVREELKRKVKQWVTCIVREGNKVVNSLSEFEELKRLNIKADQSIISLIDDYDFYNDMPDLLDIRHKFIRMLTNVNQDGYRSNNDLEDYLLASKFYHRVPEALEFCEFIIRGVDPGVTSIIIEESVDKKTGDTVYYPMFEHTFGDDIFEIGINHESMGSRSLFYQLYRYWMVIRDGGLLLLDEFDTHLHSMILPELIQLFTDKRINIHNAQLIITAHNTEIIDSLGRSRVVLVNKAGNESYSYRLDEVSMLRNDRPITPVYMKGKIGGTPEGIIGLTSRLADKWESEAING